MFIEEILGVKDYSRAVERLKGLPLDEGEGVRLNKEAPGDVRRRLEATRRELERLRGEKRRLEGELSSLEEALSGLEAEIAGLTRYRGEAEELRVEAGRLEAEASQLRESLSRALERLKSLEERARQLEELRRECGRLEGLAALRGPLEELRSGQESTYIIIICIHAFTGMGNNIKTLTGKLMFGQKIKEGSKRAGSHEVELVAPTL